MGARAEGVEHRARRELAIIKLAAPLIERRTGATPGQQARAHEIAAAVDRLAALLARSRQLRERSAS